MTKFILHGGMTSVRNEDNKNFYQEIVKDFPENPKILICLFAIDENRWGEEYQGAQDNFIDNLKREDLEFQLAQKNKFMEQLKWADAIHFRGGTTLKILEILKKYPEFKNRLKGKTVSGSSAGALFLVENFYDQDCGEIFKGLGIIPINLITHYNSETYGQEPEEILEKLKNGKELILIKETEFKVFKIAL